MVLQPEALELISARDVIVIEGGLVGEPVAAVDVHRQLASMLHLLR